MGNRTALKDAWSNTVTRANVTLAVGFGCAVSISPTLLTAATPDNMMNALVNKPPHGACMPSLVAAVLACLVIVLGGQRLFAALERTVKPLSLGVAMALMGAVLVLPLATRNSVTVTGDVVISVAGALTVLLYLFWMQLFGRLSAQSMFLTLFLSQVLTCAINAIVSIANIYTVIATSVALPIVSTICLRAGQREHADDRSPGEVRSPVLREGRGTSTWMLVKLAAIVFAWGVIDHLFRSEFDAFMRTQMTSTPFAVAYHAAAFVVVAAAVAFAYALLAYRERFQFGHLYRMIFLMGLASILLLPIVLAGQAAIVGYTCSVIMYQLVFLLIWVIAASVFRDRSSYAPGFFGLVYGFWSLGSLGGALFSSVFVQHLTMDNVHLIVFVAVLAVAVGYAVVFTEADANALVQIVPFKHKAPFKAKCQTVAREYQLSPRETEIAMLIAQGRDSAHIEKKLFLSRSTVQTHRMHLYQKLGIHNRQELLDIVEAADAG
ncbi:helix-turn-helix transcriptional regulator [Eggerthella timonensis]|uniref:helix-turn-helix transcriptional regulator n=1 Tax=Eggerthella timonensis TaxID=1871008 RepID=UPI000C763F46|nr:helix-turn-helix transcriptional regulator [Eggerthella timonensis]